MNTSETAFYQILHRPTCTDKAVACICAARKLESLVSLRSLEPSNELLLDREPNEAYFAADKTRALAVDIPSGGEVRLDVCGVAKTLTAHWINIDTGEYGPRQALAKGTKISLSSPGKQNWAAAILAR